MTHYISEAILSSEVVNFPLLVLSMLSKICSTSSLLRGPIGSLKCERKVNQLINPLEL